MIQLGSISITPGAAAVAAATVDLTSLQT
jgi:hypothetical protein